MSESSSARDARSVAASLAVAVLLVVAGCQAAPGAGGGNDSQVSTTQPSTDAPTTAAAETQTPSTDRPGRSINVEGGTLPVDPNVVWERVAAMVDTGVGPPSTIRLENLAIGSSTARTPFERALGVPATAIPGFAGTTPQSGDGGIVKLHRQLTDDEMQLEATLAHEYVHVVQLRSRADDGLLRSFSDGERLTPDELSVFRATIEGAAEYVETRYARRHLGFDGDRTRTQYLNATSTSKRLIAPYYLGARYVNATVDGPDELGAVYESPPRTTEELLHGLEPGSEPPAALRVSADADRRVEQSGPYGELAVRTLFGTALDEPGAAALADGWGNDTRLGFGSPEDGERSDFAWVLRWDDAANATEFENGVAAYLDAREPNASVRVDRVAPETTVVFAGEKSFVADATASGENETVTIAT